jgi:hypothetical protein
MNTKINKEFENFKVKTPNVVTSPWTLGHLHADFIELKTLFWDKNSFVTIQDIITHYKDYKEDDEKEIIGNSIGSAIPDINDKWNTRIWELFEILRERENIYGNYYPFRIEVGKDRIILKSNLTTIQKVYLGLLLASSLNNFPVLESEIEKEFEKISSLSLKEYLPSSNVKEFGKNTSYMGNTIAKINQLSEELNLQKRDDEILKLSKYAAQEKGLDLLAYIPFKDKISSMIIILVQCACGKNWKGKLSETEAYEVFLDFYKLKPIHSMFVPYALVNETKLFYESDKTSNKLFFERKRILENIIDLDFFNKLSTKEIVEKCIDLNAYEV